MQFLNPLVFFGLLTLAIPVLIHLFNFRKPRRVYFTNVKFLRELKLQSKRKSKLKHLLVLLLRLLAFAALVLAFAIPVLTKNQSSVKKGKPLVVVWIDNSFSMQSLGDRGELLESAIRNAAEVAGYYEPADEFYLIANDFSSRFSRIVNQSDFLEMITTVDFSPISRSAAEVLLRVDMLRKEHPNHHIDFFIISDFQQSTVKLPELAPDESTETYLLPLNPIQKSNVFIDSVWLDIPVLRPGQITNFQIHIQNTSQEMVEDLPVSLSLNNREVAVATVSLPPEGDAVAKLTTRIGEEGFYHGTVSVEDQPVTFDDKFYLGFRVSGIRRVLSLYQSAESGALKRLFADDSLFIFQSTPATQIDFSKLNSFDIVYCQGIKEMSGALVTALSEYVTEGGTLVIIPEMESGKEQSANKICDMLSIVSFGKTDTTDTRLESIQFDHPLYKGVYSEKPSNLAMPSVYTHVELERKFSSGEEVIMKLINDRPLLMSATAGKGMVFLMATGLDEQYSGFASYAELFVPPFYNMALYSGVVPPLYYTPGDDQSVSISGDFIPGDYTLRVKAVFRDLEFIPGHRAEPFGYHLFLSDQVKEAGNYSVFRGDEVIASLAFNYDQLESDLKVTGVPEMKEWINAQNFDHVHIISTSGKKVDDKLREMHEGERLWRWFIIAALVFLLAEALLLRLWR